MKNKIVLIPAYMPGNEMLILIKKLNEENFEIIIVNDGSGGDCLQIFSDAKKYATVLEHEVNKGKGAALKTGLSYIKDNFEAPYIVVTADADGQHRPEDIKRVCEDAINHPDSLTLGSRQLDKNVPMRSKLGNSITRFVYLLSTRHNIYDTQTGLRAFSDHLISRLLDIEGMRYEYEMNMLLELTKENIELREVCIETVYMDDNASSHFNAIKDSYRIYKEILKFSLSSLVCFFIDYLLYCILLRITEVTGIPQYLIFSNVIARIISATVNYNLNRRYVFKSEGSVKKSAFQYAMLACGVLICNTIILKTLTVLGMNRYVAKIITEMLLFMISWLVQRCIIFGKERH